MQKLDQITEKNRFANTNVYHSESRISANAFKDKCQVIKIYPIPLVKTHQLSITVFVEMRKTTWEDTTMKE